MAKANVELTRVNINLPTSVVNRVKEYADKMGINSTSAYIVLLNQALEQKAVVDNLPVLLTLYDKLKSIDPNLSKE